MNKASKSNQSRSQSTALPPHSIEAERAVLGGVLLDSEAIVKAKSIVDHGDFYHTHNQRVFGAMLDVYESGMACDLVTVCERLKDLLILDKIGGHAYLSGLVDETPTAANIEHHARIVKDKSLLRQLMDQAQGIISSALEHGARPENIPTRLSIETRQNIGVRHVTEITHDLNKNIERGYPGHHPCYDLLSRTIRKVSPGHLWVVGGYTSIGKSAWLVDFICRMYRNTFKVDNPGIAIFSTEMSAEQYLIRCLSNQTKIPGWCITENMVTPIQAQEIMKAQTHFKNSNFYIYDRLYKIEDIEKTARMLKEEKGLDIIAIDYLQNLWGEGSIYERMSRLAPVLQYLAKDLQITIIALSQVSNQHVREKGSGVFGYKGAGEIAASADLGIELSRDPLNKERMIFKVEKNRHGRLGEGILEYVNGYVRLNEIAEGQQEEYGG